MLKIKEFIKNKDLLTLWMNNLLVVYAFMLPISQTIKASVFTFIAILFVLRGDVLKYIKESLQNKVVRAFLYFFLITLLGVLWSDNVKEGLYWAKSVKYGLYLILFYAFIDGRYIDKVLSAFILGMFVSEITSYGILFGVLPYSLDIGVFHFYTAPSMHDPSAFLNHIHYGVALALVVPLIAQKIFYSDTNKVFKIFMILFVLTATANIFVTGGRTGYVAFVLLLLFLSVSYLKKYAIGVMLFLMLVLGVAYQSSSMFHSQVDRTKVTLEQLFTKNPNFNTSFGSRVGTFYYGFEAVKNDWLFGLGTGDSMDKIKEIAPKNLTIIQNAPHEHNQFLSTFIKNGIIGLLIFLNIYYQIFRYKQTDKQLRFIMVVSTLVIAFGLLTTQFNLRFFMPLWVVMLSITLISKDRRTIFTDVKDSLTLKQIVTVGAIFSVSSLVYQSIIVKMF